MIALNGTRHSDSVYPYLKTGIEHSALYSFSFVDLSQAVGQPSYSFDTLTRIR